MLELKQKNIIELVLVSATKYSDISIEILKPLVKRKISGIYLALNKPYDTLIENFKGKLDTEKLFFIDAVSRTAGSKTERKENALFVNAPTSLTEISIAMEQILQITTEDKFLYLDSVSTLLTYNNEATTIKFIHFLINKLRASHAIGIFIVLREKAAEHVVSELAQFCDRVIEVK